VLHRRNRAGRPRSIARRPPFSFFARRASRPRSQRSCSLSSRGPYPLTDRSAPRSQFRGVRVRSRLVVRDAWRLVITRGCKASRTTTLERSAGPPVPRYSRSLAVLVCSRPKAVRMVRGTFDPSLLTRTSAASRATTADQPAGTFEPSGSLPLRLGGFSVRSTRGPDVDSSTALD